MTTGKLIVLEGIDGCGKSTQTKLLVDYLVRMSVPYILAKQPSTGPVGKLLRQILSGDLEDPGVHVLAMLFAADRAHQADREISPALARGDVVLCDRYYHSSMAYQTDGTKHAACAVRALNEHAPEPDLTIVLTVPTDRAAARVVARAGGAEIFDDHATQAVVARAYRSMVRWLPGERIVYVDGDGDVAQVHERILSIVQGMV